MDLFIILIISHYIGDFLLQPRWMGEGKSSSLQILFAHVLTYTSSIIIFSSLFNLVVYKLGYTDILFNINLEVGMCLFLGHFFTDIWTSKLTTKYYLKYVETGEKSFMGKFWYVIGLDQTIHFIHLYLTFKYLML